MKHYSELTEKQVCEMWSRCVDAAVAYATEINMSGLSQNGSHNIYNALEHAIFQEWKNAKLAKRNGA